MKRRRPVVVVGSLVGDAETTGFGALGFLVLMWALAEMGRRKLDG
jgi:hypothetical protein